MVDSPLKQNIVGRRLDASRIVTKLIPIDAIEDHPENYNGHPAQQLMQLSESHAEFGQYRTILVWARPGGKYIRVVGHGYSQGAQQSGETVLRCEVLPEDTDPVTVKAIMTADNLHAQNSEPDDEALAQLLQEQQDAGFDLTSLGTDDEYLRQLLESLGDEYLGESEGEDDDFDEEPDEEQARVRLGDVWQLGEHRLYVGDCTKIENVKLLMNGEYADCCWTDPPYGVNYVGKTKDALTIQNDDKEDIDIFLKRAFAAMDTALKDGAAIYIAHPPGALSVTFGVRFLAQGWRLHETLVWVKDSMVLGHSDYHYRHEPIFFGYKQGEGRRGRGNEGWYGDNSQTSVFEIPRPKRSEEHPTMKPIELIQEMLRNSCPRGGLVYEPFGGSGSTLIAAHQLKMRCNICELDPMYGNTILARWEQLTNQQAQLLERAEEAAHA